MRKLSREQKIELYEKRQAGITINALAKEYGLRKEGVKYLIRLIDVHGYDILRNGRSRHYPVKLKEQAIREVLNENKSIGSTAIKYGLSSKTALTKWIKDYIRNGNTVIEHKRGRPKKMETR